MSDEQKVASYYSSLYQAALEREVAQGLHPGIEVQKPDGSVAVVGEQLPGASNSYMYGVQLPLTVDATPRYGEQCDEPAQPTWEQVEAALSRRGMVAVERAWHHDAVAAMKADERGGGSVGMPGGSVGMPANALRGLHGEKWR